MMALPRRGVCPLVQVADPVVGAERRDVVPELAGHVRGVNEHRGPGAGGGHGGCTAADTAATGTTVAVGEVIRSMTTSRVRREQAAAYAAAIASWAAPTKSAGLDDPRPARAA